MEKCNCKYCEQKEFFTGFDANGKYTGEVTETPLSVYDQLQEALDRFNKRGCVNELTVSIAEAMNELDRIDTDLMRFEKNASIHSDIRSIREELY